MNLELPPPLPWMADALCAQIDPDLWFPEKGRPVREAKAICARCPVAAECLDHALTHHEAFGVWGGVSERARRLLAGNPDTDVDDLDQTA